MQELDLIIVGAGPVGLYAAFYAGMRGLSVAIIESAQVAGGQPQNLTTPAPTCKAKTASTTRAPASKRCKPCMNKSSSAAMLAAWALGIYSA